MQDNKAFSTILDANVTTLMTTIILFWQGSKSFLRLRLVRYFGEYVCCVNYDATFFNSLADANALNLLDALDSIPSRCSIQYHGRAETCCDFIDSTYRSELVYFCW